MEEQTINKFIHGDWMGYLISYIPFLNIILWVIVIYAIVKLYRKLTKFLDKNS